MKRTLAALVLLIGACGGPARPASIAGSACQAVDFDGARFTVCTAEPKHDRVRLVVDPAVRTLSALAETLGPDRGRVRFAMNGGMYDDSGQPIGLAVIEGRQVHPLNRRKGAGNFHLLPNGVFSQEGDGWHVRTSDAYAALPPVRPDLATQSGPMLVIGGKLHPQISPDGTSLYIRNAVGMGHTGNAYFVISDQPVSFGKLARLFRDRLGCTDALFLDGAVSALWDPASGRVDRTVPLGPLLVVERSRSASTP